MKLEQFHPTQDWILIRKIHMEFTEGGIVKPFSAQEGEPDARVMAVGPGRYLDGRIVEPRIKRGDYVIIDPAVTPQVKGIELSKEIFFLVRESDVIGIIVEEADDN